MDSDCLICFESHLTIECPERKQENCPDCHAFINRFADHTAICSKKTWIFQPYEGLYAAPPVERVIVGCNSPMRFFYDGCWRKFTEGAELYSAESAAMIRFKTDQDFSVLTTSFAPIRILVTVRENGTFVGKLLLLSSKTRFLVAKGLNEPFDRNEANESHTWKTTLILGIGSIDDLCLSAMITPNLKLARTFEMRFDKFTKQFVIPDAINMVNSDTTTIDNANCMFCHGAHHGISCKRLLSRCYDCHNSITKKQDHAENCSAKDWFKSENVDVYVKIPAVRMVISFGTPIHYMLNGLLLEAQSGSELFSGMADAHFKFETSSKITIKTTGYTRIRVPIIHVNNGRFIEKLVLITSHDRTVIAAAGSRIVSEGNILNDVEHNTPIVLFLFGAYVNISIDAHSGGNVHNYDVLFDHLSKKYEIRKDLDVKSNNFATKMFDADLPIKKYKRER